MDSMGSDNDNTVKQTQEHSGADPSSFLRIFLGGLKIPEDSTM